MPVPERLLNTSKGRETKEMVPNGKKGVAGGVRIVEGRSRTEEKTV